jgi:hypothetical protein
MNIPKAIYYAVMEECVSQAAKIAAVGMTEDVAGIAVTLFENRLISIEEAIVASKKRNFKDVDWDKILEVY